MVSNLAETTCVECGERYDTPHKEECVNRRNLYSLNGKPRILVKMADVDLSQIEPPRADKQY